MGIYYNSIYGIRIYNFTDNDFANTLYEVIHNETMTYAQMREAYLFYTGLHDKNVSFQIYTECVSTLGGVGGGFYGNNRGNYMNWLPISLETFIKKFDV